MPRASSGDAIWIDLADKLRPAVVLDVHPDRPVYFVAYGTQTEHGDWKGERLDPASRPGRLLGLTRPTWFYPANVHRLDADDIDRVCGPAPTLFWQSVRQAVYSWLDAAASIKVTGPATIGGLTGEDSAMVHGIVAKDGEILDALRKA